MVALTDNVQQDLQWWIDHIHGTSTICVLVADSLSSGRS